MILILSFLAVFNTPARRRRVKQGDIQSGMALVAQTLQQSDQLLSEIRIALTSKTDTFSSNKQSVIDSVAADLDALRAQHELMQAKIDQCRRSIEDLL